MCVCICIRCFPVSTHLASYLTSKLNIHKDRCRLAFNTCEEQLKGYCIKGCINPKKKLFNQIILFSKMLFNNRLRFTQSQLPH